MVLRNSMHNETYANCTVRRMRQICQLDGRDLRDPCMSCTWTGGLDEVIEIRVECTGLEGRRARYRHRSEQQLEDSSKAA